jgi:hypothetical protein
MASSRPSRTFVTDGRNFLLLQPRTYDLSVWNLVDLVRRRGESVQREFTSSRAFASPGSVLQQWISCTTSAHDILFVLGSVRSEFRFVWIYLLGEQGIIMRPTTRRRARRRAHGSSSARRG